MSSAAYQNPTVINNENVDNVMDSYPLNIKNFFLKKVKMAQE